MTSTTAVVLWVISTSWSNGVHMKELMRFPDIAACEQARVSLAPAVESRQAALKCIEGVVVR